MLEFDRKTETLSRDGRAVARVGSSDAGEAEILIGSTVLQLTRHGNHGWRYRLACEHEPGRGFEYQPTGLKRGGTITSNNGRLELRASLFHHRRWELIGDNAATIEAHERTGYPIDRIGEGWQTLSVIAKQSEWSTPDALATLTFACWLIGQYESMPHYGTRGGP